jgi:hypothetical protein
MKTMIPDGTAIERVGQPFLGWRPNSGRIGRAWSKRAGRAFALILGSVNATPAAVRTDPPKSSSRSLFLDRLENLYGQAIRLSIGGPKNPEAQAKCRSSDRKLQKTNAIGEVSGPEFNHEPPLDRISLVCFDR